MTLRAYPTPRPLRIAMDARSLVAPALRGMDRYLLGLSRALTAAGVRITFLYRQREPIHRDHLAGLDVDLLPLPDRRVLQWEQFSVPRALRRGNFDLYHAPGERGIPLFAPCPTVLTYHSATAESYQCFIDRGLLPGSVADYLGYTPRKNFYHAYARAQLRRASHVLTVSEFSRREIIELLGVAPDRVSVTPLAADDLFRQPPHPPQEQEQALRAMNVRRPYLLYVGGYEPHKNVPGLLQMFAHARAKMPDLRFVCVGSSAPPQSLHAEAARLHCQDATLLLSGLGPQLLNLYDGCELLVSMSWRESFGLPALEAMSRGKCVVASSWGAIPEVAAGAGVFIDPRDPAAAADAVVKLLQSPDRPAMESAARARALTYTWQRTANQTLAVYNRVLQGRRSPSSEGRQAKP